MRAAVALIRNRLDRMGILLSGLCALHCLAGIFLVAGLGLGGDYLFAPAIHRIGLALAIVIGGITLAIGVIRHGDPRPLQIGGAGLALMALALAVGHGLSSAASSFLTGGSSVFFVCILDLAYFSLKS